MYKKYGIHLYKTRIYNAFSSSDINGHEMDFLDDMLVIINKEGIDLKLTKKQENHLDRIFRKTGAYRNNEFPKAGDWLDRS